MIWWCWLCEVGGKEGGRETVCLLREGERECTVIDGEMTRLFRMGAETKKKRGR